MTEEASLLLRGLTFPFLESKIRICTDWKNRIGTREANIV